MEKILLEYEATENTSNCAHVGVAGSGDLEILMEPSNDGRGHVIVRTSVDGFGQIWKSVMDRFFAQHPVAVCVEINDFGATPGVVSLRLAQAVEVLRSC